MPGTDPGPFLCYLTIEGLDGEPDARRAMRLRGRINAAARAAAEHRRTTYHATDSAITIGIYGPDAAERVNALQQVPVLCLQPHTGADRQQGPTSPSPRVERPGLRAAPESRAAPREKINSAACVGSFRYADRRPSPLQSVAHDETSAHGTGTAQERTRGTPAPGQDQTDSAAHRRRTLITPSRSRLALVP